MSYASNFGVVPAPVYAGCGARLVAAAIDCAIVWYAAGTAWAGFAALCAQAALFDAPTLLLLGASARPAALLLYFIAFEGGVGTTLGKRMLFLRVRGADGRPPGFARATARNLAKALCLVTLGLGFFLPCLVLQRRRALHDMMSACVVLRA